MIRFHKTSYKRMAMQTTHADTSKNMSMQYNTKSPLSRRQMRDRLVANIFALGNLIEGPNMTDLGKELFFKAIKLEAKNLRDLDQEFGNSNGNSSRQISSVCLLDNISALRELFELKTLSEIGQSVFWDAIKLELKTFKDINLDEDVDATECRQLKEQNTTEFEYNDYEFDFKHYPEHNHSEDLINNPGKETETPDTSFTELICPESESYSEDNLSEDSETTVPSKQTEMQGTTCTKLNASEADPDHGSECDFEEDFERTQKQHTEMIDATFTNSIASESRSEDDLDRDSKTPSELTVTHKNSITKSGNSDSEVKPSSEAILSFSSPILLQDDSDVWGKRRNRMCSFSMKKKDRGQSQVDSGVAAKPMDSASNSVGGTVVTSSSPVSSSESRTSSNRRLNRRKTLPFLPRLFRPPASQNEWLRSVKRPLQGDHTIEPGVMEMVFYVESKDGKCSIIDDS